jgi:HEAT repeat protein
MSRQYAFGRLPACLATALLALTLAGCPQDDRDPQTWIEKLDDPGETQAAVTWLQRLKDPVAIKPLAKVWEERGRPERVLRVIIELAETPDAQGKTHWEEALPVLRKALEEFDVSDNRSIENAKMAADALGKAKDQASVESLVTVVNKSMPQLSAGQEVRRSAVAALGQFGSETRAVDTLIAVITTDPKDQPVHLFAAAANALGETRSPKAVIPLIEAIYKIAPIYQQGRRAIIAIGKPAIPELIKVFQGEHTEINALAKKNDFNTDCKKEQGPESKCKAPSNLEFKSASLLGDLYAKEAVDVLTAGLKKEALPAFFQPNGAPGPTQHTAILDALRKINDPKAAAAVRAYWQDPNTDDMVRPMGIDVYSTLATDTEALAALAKLIKDDGQEEQIRMAAGQAYGRLVRDTKDFEPLVYMVDRYKKEATKNDKEAQKIEPKFEQAKKDKNQAKMDEIGAELSMAQGRAAAYRNFQRAFEQHLARAHAGVRCKEDPKCYAGILDESGDDIGKKMGEHVSDLAKWSPEEKNSLKIAAAERALLELIKLDDKARPVMDTIMKHVESTDRIMRQGTLLVMVHAAQLPCDDCIKRLDEIIEKQKDESTLAQLSTETQAVRNYFLWAGR